jgi:para-nitrobenzyl esterase
VVTINYRLGALGYLALDQLRARDPSNSTGNYGSQDQRACLRWIKENIAAFGGDPDKIVLWGESAGAAGVTAQLAMEKSWSVSCLFFEL